MSMGMTTTSTQVTISGGVTTISGYPVKSATQTIINKGGTATYTAGNNTLYTKTVGKTFYITALNFRGDTGSLWAAITDGVGGANLVVFGTSGSCYCMTFPVPLVLTGAVLNLSLQNNCVCYISYSGYEE